MAAAAGNTGGNGQQQLVSSSTNPGSTAAASGAAMQPEQPAKAAVLHIREDSDSKLNELFDVIHNPGHKAPLHKPLRMRNLPPSFFNPPTSGGTKSPGFHSREGSIDNSSGGGGVTAGVKVTAGVGSPPPPPPPPHGLHHHQHHHHMGQQQQHLQLQSLQPLHNRSQSAPVELQPASSSAAAAAAAGASTPGSTSGAAAAAAASQQQQVQQHLHLRQPSYDLSISSNLGPLPPGWEAARTPAGQLYFMNHITKTTQWEDPRIQIQQQQLREQRQIQQQQQQQQMQQQQQQQQMQQQQQQQQQQQGESLGPLPPGWEQGITPDGEIYFINHVEKTTSWFDPRLPTATQTVPIIRNQQQQLPPPQAPQQQQQQQQPHLINPVVGMTAAQKRQQDMRLQRLENERRALELRQAELRRCMERRAMASVNGGVVSSSSGSGSGSGGNGSNGLLLQHQESMQAAVNATQEMLMRQNLNDGPAAPPSVAASAAAASVTQPVSLFGAQLQQQQQQVISSSELHNRQESADSGLGMGSNFNLGSIPEDISMDTTDLDTTLTEVTTVVGGGPAAAGGAVVTSSHQQHSGRIMAAATSSSSSNSCSSANGGNVVSISSMDTGEQLMTDIPEFGDNDGDLILSDILENNRGTNVAVSGGNQVQWI